MVPAAWSAWIWIEGEDATSSNIRKHPWYYGETDKSLLSGGDFLAHFDAAQAGSAEYEFTVAEAGRYTLWLRANPTQASLKFMLDSQPEQAVDFNEGRTGDVNIARDKKPDLRFLAWCRAGAFDLPAGRHRLRFLMDSANQHHGALDCLVLTTESFTPLGTLKPDQKAAHLQQIAEANKGWLPWSPPRDDFKATPIDLRRLNEAYAGEHGWIRADQDRFLLGDTGTAVRFWGVNGPPEHLRGGELAACARQLAKRGVNLVRLHGAVFDAQTGAYRPEQAAHKREIIAAMKAEGIYSHLSIYFPLWLTPADGPGWREGYDGEKHPFALLFFEPEFQELYRGWWKQLLTTPGPGGKTLLEEPALMGLELQNEDSLFFWTFAEKNIPDPQLRKLEARFGAWAARKYGSADKALQAWKLPLPRDRAEEGRLAFRPLYELFSRKTPRDQDTAAFLLETQRAFYEDTIRYLRGLGYRGLITASNWTTANNEILGPLEKASYLPGDFLDRHGYFECNHQGDNAGWSLRTGHTYSDRSALRFDPEAPGQPPSFSHPATDPMFNAKPSMLSETAWTRPNRYRGEAPLFFAAYGALQDSDAIVHFALEGADWQAKPEFFMRNWTLMAPTQIGQFPAAALIYRQGLVRTGDLMADLPLKLEDALALRGSPLAPPAHLDELRKADGPSAENAPAGRGIDPLLYFTGRTNLQIGGTGPGSLKDASALIDRAAKTVASSTGEISLDFGKGVLVLNAPAAQGAGGNLREKGTVELRDLSISSDLDLIHIVAVSLDGKALAASSQILLQVMTEEKPEGFATEPAGNGTLRITQLGQDPWLVREAKGTVRFKRPDAGQLKATALDANGYAAASAGTADRIELQPGTAYYLIAP
jgi:hypothetical protein